MPPVTDLLSSNASSRYEFLPVMLILLRPPSSRIHENLSSSKRLRQRYSSVSRSRKNSRYFLLNSPFPGVAPREDLSEREGDAERISDALRSPRSAEQT